MRDQQGNWSTDDPHLAGQTPILYPPEHLPPEYRPRERRSPRWPFITCGVVIGVLFLPCLLVTWLVGWSATQVAGSNTVVAALCRDLTTQRYAAVYDDLLSTRLQQQEGRDEFVAMNLRRDATDGRVRGCRSPLTHFSITSGQSAVARTELALEITRGRTYAGTITLVRQGGSWKIDQLDPVFGLL